MNPSPNHASRDDTAPMAVFVLLKLKEPRDLAMRYYRDVHGTLGARACGLHHQYFQHHLDPSTGHEWWNKAPGVSYACGPDDQADVIAEPTFVSPKMLQAYGRSEVNWLLYVDERYFVDRSCGYRTLPGNSKTLLDRTADGAHSGPQPIHKLLACLAKRPEVGLGPFRAFVRDRLAPAFAAAPEALKVRYHLPEPYDAKLWDPPHVDHARTAEQEHHAFLEIGFTDAIGWSRCLDGGAYAATLDEQSRHLRAMHVFRERAVYTLGYDGQATLDGVRSPSVAETIRAVGAAARAAAPDRRLYYHGMVDDQEASVPGTGAPARPDAAGAGAARR